MNVLLYGKVIKKDDLIFLQALLQSLINHNITVYTTSIYQNTLFENEIDYPLKKIESIDRDQLSKMEMVFSIGGDGTMLASAMIVKDLEIPILGFNTGRMGFLANIDKNSFDIAIKKIINKEYSIEKRSMLRINSSDDLFLDFPYALNDFTIQKKTTSSMITIHSYVNDEYFNSYWCNGIIVSTPTGSTAFSMSCGGPIVLPDAKNFVLTPIAPHNLNIRPVILPDHVKLSFEIESRSHDIFCTLDSRFEVIHPETKLDITKNDFNVSLVKLDGESYFTTLRNKLFWGRDVRNR